jgi:hypothetical protein
MLTRALACLLLIGGMAVAAAAEDAKVLTLGITDHAPTQAELEKGGALPQPKFNTPAVAYVLAANLKKGDTVEISLMNEGRSLMHNTETLAEDRPSFMLLVGKRGVPAGGWPEGTYQAGLKITRDGKTVIEDKSKAIPFN